MLNYINIYLAIGIAISEMGVWLYKQYANDPKNIDKITKKLKNRPDGDTQGINTVKDYLLVTFLWLPGLFFSGIIKICQRLGVVKTMTKTKAREWIAYANFDERRGAYTHIHAHPRLTRMCNSKDDIFEIKLIEDPEGSYWSWEDFNYHKGKVQMIFDDERAFRICFPYGVQAEINSNNGRVVKLRVERLNKVENI